MVTQRVRRRVSRPTHPRRRREKEVTEDAYRDRAKERRLGIGGEYEITEDAVKDLTVEESKYLGGDMEHTHLVKGLDFALLAKVRSEMDEKEQGEEALENKKTENRKASEALAARSALGSAVRLHLMADAKKSRPSELFLQGRTHFVFSFDDAFGDIPTTKSKSVEDLPAAAREKKVTIVMMMYLHILWRRELTASRVLAIVALPCMWRALRFNTVSSSFQSFYS